MLECKSQDFYYLALFLSKQSDLVCLCMAGTTVPDTHLHIKTHYPEDTQSAAFEVRSVIVTFALLSRTPED